MKGPPQQLLRAAMTVTKRTPPARRKVILRMLNANVVRGSSECRLAAYYLSLGDVPRGLWEL